MTALPRLDPSGLMRPDPDRLRAFADDLATGGEIELAHLVRRVATDVTKAMASGHARGQAERSAATSASASVASL